MCDNVITNFTVRCATLIQRRGTWIELAVNRDRAKIKKNKDCAWRKKKITGLSVIKCDTNDVMTKRFYVTQMFTTVLWWVALI